jgi:hypothetical protein
LLRSFPLTCGKGLIGRNTGDAAGPNGGSDDHQDGSGLPTLLENAQHATPNSDGLSELGRMKW